MSEPKRCWTTTDPAYNAYHDDEWGRPVTDERGLLERLCLEGFQSGLSWLTILRKRDNFRAAFANFEAETVARFGESDVQRLLGDTGIVRHRGKIEAAIGTPAARSSCASGERRCRSCSVASAGEAPGAARQRRLAGHLAGVRALSKALKRAGFRFVGPTTVYAAMQACGVVNDHLADCFVRAAVQKEIDAVA